MSQLQQQPTVQQTIQQQQLQSISKTQPSVTSNQLGSLTVQTLKAPTTLRGTVQQQIQPSTAVQQQQQLIQQALKSKQPLHVLQRTPSSSQIQQMLAGQKLTPQQLQQLQQQQRHNQLQQHQQLKLQQSSPTIVSQQPKAQLVMTQVVV